MSDQRIDLTWLDGSAMQEETMENICEDLDYIEQLVAELKRCYEKEDEIIEYVAYLLATPDVLEQLMGSPSQIHTINNLNNSLEKLLEKLKNKASE